MDTNSENNEEILVEETDDIVYDESESIQDIVKKLKDNNKTLQKEKDEYLDSWQRERADFVNFKKEEETRLSRKAKLTKESMLESLLPVLDSFSTAFSNKEAWEKVDENWRRGVEYIHQQFTQALLDNGISEINPNYLDEFNAEYHQSIEDRVTDKEEEKGKIVTVMQKGYKINEYVVRPARVITGQK